MRAIQLLALGCGLASLPAGAQDLHRLSLDDMAAVSPRLELDRDVKVEGQHSLRITAQWPTTVYLGEVAGLDVENATLIYAAMVKTALKGNAFLEMWAHVGDGQYFSRGLQDTADGETDWKILRTPFVFQAGQRPDRVTLNLVINGIGTVWIDDVVLSKQALQ